MRPELTNITSIRLSKGRSRLMLFFIFCGFLVLVARALYLQGWENDYKSTKQPWLTYTEKLRANRGKITDRHNTPLAISSTVQTVCAAPKNVVMSQVKQHKLAALLDIKPALLKRRLKQKNKGCVYLKRQISPERADQIAALKIPGISFEKEYKRYYPKAELTAHVVGLTDIDEIGQEGIELEYHNWLAAKPGERFVYRDRENNFVDEDLDRLAVPQRGHDLPLSLDLRLQGFAFREIKKSVLKNQARSGSIIVLDAQSGEILALANWPSYNPNNRKTYKPRFARNLAVVDMFEPGSTVKPFNVAAAIEEGYVEPTTEINIGDGKLKVGGKLITDTHPKKGTLTVSEIIKVSSNVGSTEIALRMPSEDLWKILSSVGFGKYPKSGFPGEARGRLRKHNTWKKIERATMSYGHGMSVSLLQLARAYTVFTAGGRLLPISFVKRDAVPTGQRILSSGTANAVTAMLEGVTSDEGTGPQARVPGYRVAGKTGTAHKIISGVYSKSHYYSSFVGFAPVSAPKLIVAVVVDDPRGGAYYGGQVAGPVFSEVMGRSLRLLGVREDSPKETLTAEREFWQVEG